MNRYVIFFLLVFSFIHSRSFAQDVGTGKIVSSLKDFKALSSVDYTTGTMNYNIPLLNLQQDGYEIPVSLSYNAKGIKITDETDIAGLGWSLNYGSGIVSRTLRGGIADENKHYGILFNLKPSEQAALLKYEEDVAHGKIDGESDIFTVNIQGNTIKFVITLDSGQLVANPLKKTDVIIECIFEAFSYKLSGFRITDIDGIVYDFESTNPSIAHLTNPAAANSSLIEAITTWYLKKISMPNNGDIKFEYTNDFLLWDLTTGDTYTQYGKPKFSPKLGQDGTLDTYLASYYNSQAGNNQQIDALKSQIRNTMLAVNSLDNSYRFVSQEDSPNESMGFLNNFVLDVYMDQLNGLVKNFNDLIVNNNNINASMRNTLQDLFGADLVTNFEFLSSGQSNLYANKLIKRIITRTDIVDFDYIERSNTGGPSEIPNYLISKITHKTITGEVLKTFAFEVYSPYLKKVKVYAASGKTEQQYDFDYYHENELIHPYSRDYWGYYNGKANSSLFPTDLTGDGVFANALPYSIPDYFSGVIARYGGLSDRRPNENFAVARSLKKVSSILGGSTSFEYEGNEVYSNSLNRNLATGGIRIKNITTSDGHNQQTVSYKYKFPLPGNSLVLKSTGRLLEWGKKSFFASYHYPEAQDSYVFTDFINLGLIYDDNSNNGVLYHYVEEVRSDNAATGYKYLAVDEVPYVGNGTYQSFPDKLLLAKIDYNSAGKIVSIKRNTYLADPDILGCRLVEYGQLNHTHNYFQTGTFGNNVLSLSQTKKDIISYDGEHLQEVYRNAEVSRLSFNGYSFSINPYSRIYLPNYPARLQSLELPVMYPLTAGHVILLKEEETSLFNRDYNTATAYALNNASNLPDEKAYLYERLLNAPDIKPIQSTTTYLYGNTAHLNPTEIKTINSDGDISLKKIKYAADYQLGQGTPIALLNNRGQKAEVIEEQLWKSTDAGSTFKLLSGKINEYFIKTVNRKNYILLQNEYTLKLSTPLVPASLGYMQTAMTSTPYSSVFWDNKELYGTPFKLNIWDIGYTYARKSSVKDRAGYHLKTMKYDPYNADLLIEAEGVDPANLVAFDFAPYQKHPYYNKYNLFLNENAVLYKYDFRFSESPLSNNRIFNIEEMNNKLYTSDIDSALNAFQINISPQDVLVLSVPFYQALRKMISKMARLNDANEFIKAYVEYKKAKVLMTSNDESLMQILSSYGVSYDEIKAYLIRLDNYFYNSFDGYDKVFNDTGLKIMPVGGVGYRDIPLSVDVDNLITANTNLDLFVININPGVSTYTCRYRIRYKNNTYSSPASIYLSADKKIGRAKLVLNTLANASQIKSIEFLVDDGFLYRMAMLVAIPENIQFKATGYLPNHLPYISFDQSGRCSEIVYDEMLNRRFVKDFNDHIIQADTLAYARHEPDMIKQVRVTIANEYAENIQPATNILSVIFYNNETFDTITKDIMVIPGYAATFEMPEGNYSIHLATDRAVGRAGFGNQEVITNSLGAYFSGTISAAQPYYISIRPASLY